VPARASQLVFGLSHFLPNDVVAVSSSDTNEALKFLMLELECSDSPRPVQTNVQGTSSESSMGSEWFEDWPEANNMVARFYVNLSMESSPSCRDHGRASCCSRGRPCARISKISSMSCDQRPTRRKSTA
jgi:hypothetical protein